MRKGLEVAITPKPFIFVLLQNLSFLQQSYLSACSTRNRATSCLSYSYIPYTHLSYFKFVLFSDNSLLTVRTD